MPKKWLALLVAGHMLSFSSHAIAEQSSAYPTPHLFDPIMVTAQKREQEIQKIPASISVITSQKMEDYQIEKMKDVFKYIPNIYITKTGPASQTSTFGSIRGITSSMGGGKAIGVYVDDVYYPGIDMDFLDVKRVEVLRGPQGTLYGRNAEAGVINVVTKEPGNTWEGKIGTDYGSFNTRAFQGSFSGPLVEDALYIRTAGRYEASDNYFKNKFTDDNSVNKYENKDMRFKIETTPSDSFKATLGVDLRDYWSGGYADFAPLGSARPQKNVNVDYIGYSKQQNYGSFLRLENTFDSCTLVSVTAANKDRRQFANDIDFTPIDLFSMGGDLDTMQYSQELRLLSNDDNNPFQWLVGTFGFYEEHETRFFTDMNFTAVPGMGFLGKQHVTKNAKTDSTGIAFFGQASYTLWEKLELTAGLRYDRLHRSIKFNENMGMLSQVHKKGSGKKDFEAWLPKAAISYSVTDNIRPYVSVARGFREGGFNIVDSIGEPYKSEFTWNYELGAKTSWLDNKLTANIALFYIDWTDRQVEVLAPGGQSFYLQNASKVESKGVELELAANPIDGLELVGSFGYTKAKYKDYKPAHEDFSGNHVIDFPQYTASLGATYRFENGIFTGASYNRTGKIYNSLNNKESQIGYQTVDAKIGYEGDSFDVYLWGKNIFNEKYYTRVVQSAGFNGGGDWYGRAGDPQSFGLSAVIHF